MSEKPDHQVINKEEKLPFSTKLSFGLGGSASNFIWMMVGLYLLYFYTDIFGIPAAVAGTLFLVARVFDAINDPLMGYIADQTRTKWGKFRPYILFGSIPLAIVFILAFSTPDLPLTGKITYAVVTYVLLGILYTVVNIPYTSLTATITQNTNERASLASFMLITTYITVLVIAVATIPLVNLFPTEQEGFRNTVAIYAIISFILFMLCFAGTREKPELRSKKRQSFINHFKMIPQNKYLLILISAIFFTSAANEMRTTTAIYFFKYNVGDETVYPLFMAAVILAMICGAILTPILARKLGSKRNLYYLATLLTLPYLGILFVPYDNVMTIIAIATSGSIGSGMTIVLNWSMLPDTIEYGELKTGIRGEGIVYASINFTNKLAYAVGGSLCGFLLSWSGFIPNVAQTAQTQQIITYMLVLFPFFAAIIAVAIISFYKIDEKFYGEMIDQINARKT